MVSERVEHWAGGTGISFSWGSIWGPDKVMPRGASGDDVARFVRRGKDVEHEEDEVPDEDGDLHEGRDDFVEDAHVC